MAKICTLANIDCHYCSDGLCRYGYKTYIGIGNMDYCRCAQANSLNSRTCTDAEFKEIQIRYMAKMLAALRQK